MADLSQPPELPAVVYGEVVALPEGVDETREVPADIAERVSEQLLRALGERMIDPETVVFSGYDDYNNENHARKGEGERDEEEALYSGIGTAPPPGQNEYFFLDASYLADGKRGPFAYAASAADPVVGVYDLGRLRGIGYDEENEVVVATPDQVRSTMVMEFHPQYSRPDDE